MVRVDVEIEGLDEVVEKKLESLKEEGLLGDYVRDLIIKKERKGSKDKVRYLEKRVEKLESKIVEIGFLQDRVDRLEGVVEGLGSEGKVECSDENKEDAEGVYGGEIVDLEDNAVNFLENLIDI